MSCLINAVRAVEATQDFANATWTEKTDLWHFVPVIDNATCQDCLSQTNLPIPGDTLLILFPYMEVLDIDTIAANLHPHCRCYLERVSA